MLALAERADKLGGEFTAGAAAKLQALCMYVCILKWEERSSHHWIP